MKTHKANDAHGLHPFVPSSSSRLSLTQNAYPFYGHPLSIPRLHHIHHTSIMIIVNFVQHNYYTIPPHQLHFLFFDFVLYELIL